MHVEPTRRTAVSGARPGLGLPLALSLGILLFGTFYPAQATMPSAPMEMALESTGLVAVDADLTVTLTVRPLVDADQLTLTITVPAGVDLIAGEPLWAGPVRALESRTVTVTVRPREAAASVILGAARIEFPDGTILGDVRSLTLALGERSKQTLGLSPPKKTTTGESVIEFRDAP